MRILMAAFSVFLMTPFALGQAGGDPNKDVRVKEELRKLWLANQEAGSKKDRAALERVYADEFLFIHSTGGRENKTEHINAILSISSYSPAPVPEFDQLHVYGDVAVLRASLRGLLGTTIYAKKGGQWQIVQIQSTRLPPERKAINVDPKILDSYVGKYEFATGVRTTITREGGTLTAQSPGRPKFVLLPASETQFFGEGNEPEWTFYKDEKGQVTHLIVRPCNCQESRRNKVE